LPHVENLDNQISYWNRIGPEKPFSHPVNFDRLRQLLTVNSRILDFGCGYGRVLGLLQEHGFTNLIGFDPAPAMVAAARQRFPTMSIRELKNSPHLPLPDASVDAALLHSVLTCVPSDNGQREIVQELGRVLRKGGLLYISDLWLQADERNLQRYEQGLAKYGVFGVFDLPEGVTVRHHSRQWIATLVADYERVALDEIQLTTMNGHSASGFQWFGLKVSRPATQSA
jgi:SAM-dependent methyltransferase